MRVRSYMLPVFLLVLAEVVAGQNPVAGHNVVTVRGKGLDVYVYPGTRSNPGSSNIKVLFAPGDFGMHGVAVDFAQKIASWGFDVYGLDTKQYLESFTGKTTLQTTDVMNDLREIARWMQLVSAQPVILIGWSEGAGLALLAASSEENKAVFRGLVLFGLTESNVLAWHWTDYLSYLTKADPKEPSFRSADFLARVTPLPFVMIHSTGDQYTSVATAREMFALAREPRRFILVEARNHRFDGNQEEFFRRLRESLEWIRTEGQ